MKPIWIPYNHASKCWEVWREGKDEAMTFLGSAKTYKAARKIAGL